MMVKLGSETTDYSSVGVQRTAQHLRHEAGGHSVTNQITILTLTVTFCLAFSTYLGVNL